MKIRFAVDEVKFILSIVRERTRRALYG